MALLTLLFRLLGRIDDAVSRPLLAVGIVGFCVYGIDRYLDIVAQPLVAESAASVPFADVGPRRIKFMGVAQLFERLLQSGLIRFDAATGLLVLPYQDGWLRCRAANPDLDQDAGREPVLSGKALLAALFESPAGREIENAAERWNSSQFFAAIRDNRTTLNPAASAASDSGKGLPSIRKDNPWQAFGARGLRLDGGAEVPESFGFINRALQPGFSDWLRASALYSAPPVDTEWPNCALPADVAGGAVTFVSDTHYPSDATLDLQIIGRIKAFYVDDRRLSAGANGWFEPRCASSVRSYPCAAQQAKAFTSRSGRPLRLAAGRHRLTVVLEPVAAGQQRVDGLPLERLAAGDGATTLRWRSLPRTGQHGSYQILTADAISLTDRQRSGVPTEHARTLGLTPIVGLDGGHYGSLIDILNHTVPAREHWQVHLSIDGRLQAHAVAALGETIARLFPDPGSGQPERYAASRRGVLLVTDIDSGAILANASYPPVPADVHRWDHYSFLRTQSFRSPLSVMAWRNMSRHLTPGSAFKLTTAIALLQSAAYGDISGLVEGVDQAGFERAFGPLPTFREPLRVPGEDRPRYVGKADTVSDKFTKPLRRTAVGEDGSCAPLERRLPLLSDGRIGLAEALRDSLNHWFIRLVSTTDGTAARAYDAGRYAALGKIEHYPPPPQFELVSTARRLGFFNNVNLAAPLAAGSTVRRAAGRWHHTVLFAEAGRLSLAEKPGGLPQYPMAWVLAQNAIGQGVQLSPLHMTRLVTAIASDRLPVPHLLRIERSPADRAAPAINRRAPTAALGLGPKRLLLQRGMKAVVDAGTAQTAFAGSGSACRVYAKTGTAQLEKSAGRAGREPFNSAWLVGYALPANKNAPRIAFACLVTHAPHGKNDTGGKVCAPVVADFLSRSSDYR